MFKGKLFLGYSRHHLLQFVLIFFLVLNITSVFAKTTPQQATVTNNPLSLSSFFMKSTFQSLMTNKLGSGTIFKYTYSGTPSSDSVNYIQLCNAGSDTTCSICGAPFVTITGGSLSYGVQYITESSSLAAYLIRGGFAPGTYSIGTYVQSSGVNCSSGAAYCSSSVDESGTNLCMTVSFNGTTAVPVSQNDNGQVTLNNSTPQFAYVPGGNTMYYCGLKANGTFNPCNTTPTSAPSWSPKGAMLATINGTQYAYVADSSGSMYQCGINSTGVLNNCTITPSPAPNWRPQRIGFGTVNGNQYAYVSDGNSRNVYQCAMGSNGTLNSCVGAGYLFAASPRGVTFASINESQYAYVADYTSQNMYQCTLNSNGSFNTCNVIPVSGAPSWYPMGVAFTVLSATSYAYVADGNGHKMYKCTIESGGSFNICDIESGGVSDWSPYAVAIPTVNTTQYAYIADNIGAVYQCNFDSSNGNFTSCNSLSPSFIGTAWQGPQGIAFATVSDVQHAYVVDGAGNHIYYCTINNANGQFNTCRITPASGEPSWLTRGIGFATTNGIFYAYVADVSGNTYQCTLNSDGTFNACSITPVTPSWSPFGVALAIANGTQYAYVADSTGNIDQCEFDNTTGAFTSCTPTPASGAPSWGPYGVTFTWVNGSQYAYVASLTSEIYYCTMNANGSFNTCVTTPESGAPSWIARGVSFGTTNGTQYAYVATATSGSESYVYQCTLNNNGTFNACARTIPTGGNPSWNPQRVTIATVNGTQYAYVSDFSTHNIYQCSLNSNGSLNICIVATGSALSGTQSIMLPYLFTY